KNSPASGIVLQASDPVYSAKLAIDLTSTVLSPPPGTRAGAPEPTAVKTSDRDMKTRPSKLLLDEQTASVVHGDHWLHRATYWLYQGAGIGFGVTLPPGAKPVRITLDGKRIPTLETIQGKYWLSAAGTCRIRMMTLYWTYS